jgi:hypothetical protein
MCLFSKMRDRFWGLQLFLFNGYCVPLPGVKRPELTTQIYLVSILKISRIKLLASAMCLHFTFTFNIIVRAGIRFVGDNMNCDRFIEKREKKRVPLKKLSIYVVGVR